MKTANTLASLQSVIQQWQTEAQRIAFVPTMGNLHAGHIALVDQAKQHGDKVVVSIYVNPLQFNDANDFNAYPKTLDADQKKLILANVDLLFLPDNDMMYPNGQSLATKVCVPDITDTLEGEHRPGHFDGVSTVVNKLFNLVRPHHAFFGEKDYQQLLLIKKMVTDLNIPITIHGVPTHREADGLAMSSRNVLLSESQRKVAPAINKVLKKAAQQLIKNKTAIIDIEKKAINELKHKGFKVEYISVRDCLSIKTPNKKTQNYLILAAAKLGDVRLIDNCFVKNK